MPAKSIKLIPVPLSLLDRSRLGRGHIECDEDSVVDRGATADEEDSFFLVGCFQRLADPHGGRRLGSDFDHVEPAVRVVLGVRGQRVERVLCGGREVGLAALDAPDAQGGKDMLPHVEGVVHEIDVSKFVGLDIKQIAAVHDGFLFGSIYVTEGWGTAVSMIERELI